MSGKIGDITRAENPFWQSQIGTGGGLNGLTYTFTVSDQEKYYLYPPQQDMYNYQQWQQQQYIPSPPLHVFDGKFISEEKMNAIYRLGHEMALALPEDVEDAYYLTPAQYKCIVAFIQRDNPFYGGGYTAYMWRGVPLIEVKNA